jgi:UDP-2-acetamido-3-amino-2,3-dideoxy-glucuronate N-acetyltransferase
MSVATKVGLVGCGRWGRNIARALSGLGVLEMIADTATEAVAPFAAELGVTLVANPRDIFTRSDIAAVAIAAPAVDHARLVSEAIAAGKHVFVEKPLALSVAEAKACAEAAERAGLTLMVGHLLQYHPAFVRLHELIADGSIGKVRHVTSHRLNSGAIRTEENALWSLAPHDFSMVLSLCGEPQRVDAQATAIVQSDIPDQYMVTLGFHDGVTGQIFASWLSPYKEHKLVVLGDTGSIVFEDTAEMGRKLVIYRDYIDRSGPTPAYRKSTGEPIGFPPDEPLKAEMAWFLDAVAGTRQPKSGPAEAIPVLEALTMADAAARR